MIFWSIAIACFAVWIAYQLKQRYEHFQTFKKLGIQGPPPSIFLGNAWDIYRLGHKACQTKWHRCYGPIIGYFLGYEPCLLIADHDILKNVLLRDFMNFTDRPDFMSGGDGGGFDNSLIALKGQRWKQVRSTLTPSFTTSKLKQIFPEMLKVVDEFMGNVDKAYVSGGGSVDLSDFYQALTLDTICRNAMGVDFGVQKDIANSKLLKQLKVVADAPITLLALPFLASRTLLRVAGPLVQKLQFMKRNEGEDPTELLKQQCRKVIKMRRADPANRRIDLLQLMLDAQSTENTGFDLNSLIAGDDAEKCPEKHQNASDSISTDEKNHSGHAQPAAGCPVASKSQGLTEEEVNDNAYLVLLAGFETTFTALGFITRLLVRFPEVQDRLREELVDATNGGTRFDFEALQRCQYLEAVIQETLRLYPPVFAVTSRQGNEEKVYENVTIPKGMSVFASTCELHNNPEVFPDPGEFRPERFLPENRTAEMMFAWQPFGAGPRNCIGMRFAQMEIKTTIAKLLTKYSLNAGEYDSLGDVEISVNNLPTNQKTKDPLQVILAMVDN